jgi:hypothetical protein
MGPEEGPSLLRRAGKPLRQRGADSGELGRSPRHGDHGEAERAVELVEVEHVEAAHHGPVDEHGPDAVERAQRADEPEHPSGPVRPVDADSADPDRLEVFGERHDHGRDRGVRLRAVEGAVIDAHELGMRFAERAPQR